MFDQVVMNDASAKARRQAQETIGACFDFLCDKYEVNDLKAYKESYLDYCNKILHIRTLASQEKTIFINDIYVPINLIESGHSMPFEVSDHTTLDSHRALVIKGLAGQGKSTILRKLLSNNARVNNRLPIFYELKNYHGGEIEESIAKHLSLFGVDVSSDGMELIISDSNVKVYLDAFDEVAPEYRGELLNEIRKLINKYNCHVVCTTRPDTEIDPLTELTVFTVCPLTESQIFGIIEKTSPDEEKASELCGALGKTPWHIESESILKSPILVVLYCISYNLGQEIPNNLSQFYQNIFETVFYRHDNIKGKVYRKRYWNDNQRIYRKIFDCLCFISQKSNSTSFRKDKLTEFVSVSLEYMSKDADICDRIAIELTSITNLIIEDGFNEYKFIHKSI